ncbi:MAG: MMPL family transporter [Bacteroidota bacterium]
MKFEDVIGQLIRHSRWVAAGLLLVTLWGAWQVQQNLRINNAVSIWFLEDNPDYRAYLDFQHERGSDEIIIAMIPTAEPLATESVELLRALHTALDSLPFVQSTFSLANAPYPLVDNRRLVYRPIYNAARDTQQVRRILTQLPALSQQLLTETNDQLFFYAQLAPTDELEANRNAVVTEVRRTMSELAPRARISGQPILNEAFNETIYTESTFFAVATVAVIILLLSWLLPSWWYVPLALVCVAVPVSTLMGIMVFSGHSLNLISMLIPTILMVYSVSDSVHVINIFHQYQQQHPEQSRATQIQAALRQSLKPCFYTTLTTVVGYLALCASPLPAFRQMGLFTFCGLALAFVFVYVVTAIGLRYVPAQLEGRERSSALVARLSRLAQRWTSQRRTALLGVGIIVLVLGAIALPQLQINTDSLHLLGEGKAKQDLFAVEAALGGNARFQLNVIRTDSNSLLNTTDLNRLADFQDRLAQNERLATPVSVINFQRFVEDRMSNFLLFGRPSPAQLLQNAPAAPTDFLSFFSTDFSETSVAVNVKELDTQQLEILLNDIDTAFAQSFPPEAYELEVHSFLALFAQLNDFILQTQFRSFGLAFVFAFGVLWYFLGNLRTTLLALLPNLLPLAAVLALMAAWGIDLEAGNAMLAPIMLGIAMDDTIHLMNHYQEQRASGQSVVAAMNQALAFTGGALFSTTIALCGGFLVVGWSGVVSVSTFGLLCAFAALAALLADILVLPALVKWLDR